MAYRKISVEDLFNCQLLVFFDINIANKNGLFAPGSLIEPVSDLQNKLVFLASFFESCLIRFFLELLEIYFAPLSLEKAFDRRRLQPEMNSLGNFREL